MDYGTEENIGSMFSVGGGASVGHEGVFLPS